MAVAVDAVSTTLINTQVADNTNKTAAMTVSASATIAIVFVEASFSNGSNDSLVSFTVMTLGSSSFTQLSSAKSHSGAGTTGYVDIYYLLSPPTGSQTFSITEHYGSGGTVANMIATCVTYTGHDGNAPVSNAGNRTNGSFASSQTISETLASGDLFVGVCCNGSSAPTMTTGTSDATGTGDGSSASHGGHRVAHNSGTGSVSLVFATNSADNESATGTKLVVAAAAGFDVPFLQPPAQYNVHRM